VEARDHAASAGEYVMSRSVCDVSLRGRQKEGPDTAGELVEVLEV
jgi:hypothetical protein